MILLVSPQILIARLQVWRSRWPNLLVKEFLVEFFGQPVLNAIGRMGSCSILTEVVVYVALDSKIPGIEFTFEHLQVIVLINGFFE
jgi:hypothetical protein